MTGFSQFLVNIHGIAGLMFFNLETQKSVDCGKSIFV